MNRRLPTRQVGQRTEAFELETDGSIDDGLQFPASWCCYAFLGIPSRSICTYTTKRSVRETVYLIVPPPESRGCSR